MKRNYLAIIVLVGVIFSGGCASQKSIAKTQFINLAGTFSAAQTVMIARLGTPSVTEEEKALYREISTRGTEYLEVGYALIHQGKFDDFNQTSATLAELLTYMRPILIDKFTKDEVVGGSN